MKLTLDNLANIAKRLHSSTYDTAIVSSREQNPPVTPGEAAVLRFLIHQEKPKSIREIVESTGLVQSWVSTTVKTLENRGWVKLGKDKADRRVTTVKAVKKIKEEAKFTKSLDADKALQTLVPDATGSEMAAIIKGLECLSEVINRQDKASQN